MAINKVLLAVGAVILIALVYSIFVGFGGKYSYDDPGTPKAIFGNPDSPVKVVEYGDIQCPACGSAHAAVKQIKEEFGDQISFEFVHFPLRNIHPLAQKASEAAECANDQGKFYEYLDVAYPNQKALKDSNLINYAGQIGLNASSFEACLKSRAKKDEVNADFDRGLKASIDATPTFTINDRKLARWNYQDFRTEILKALEKET